MLKQRNNTKAIKNLPLAHNEDSNMPHKEIIEQCLNQLNEIVLGKENEVKLAIACLLAKGHLLIEDIPGMGKTTLSHALGITLGLDYKRAQFTSDMMPADVLGGNIFDQKSSRFLFQRGPVFTNVLLADEINRAPPKTQSALLEAMEERQISLDGKTRALPEPFFVIATQNPLEQAGTYPLPESQLDRFMMRISLGYPPEEAEKEMLSGAPRSQMLESLKAKISAEQLLSMQSACATVEASKPLVDYVYRLVQASRSLDQQHGLSPRAALALLNASKAFALIEGRKQVLPDDVQAVFPYVCDHRMPRKGASEDNASQKTLKTVDIF